MLANIAFFFHQKGKNSPDYHHCQWGKGKTLLAVPTLWSGIVATALSKNADPNLTQSSHYR